MGRSVAVVIRKKEFGGEAPKEKSCSYSVIELAALIPYPPPTKQPQGLWPFPLSFVSSAPSCTARPHLLSQRGPSKAAFPTSPSPTP